MCVVQSVALCPCQLAQFWKLQLACYLHVSFDRRSLFLVTNNCHNNVANSYHMYRAVLYIVNVNRGYVQTIICSVSFYRKLVKNYQPRKKDEEDYQ
jgi:hypothetical protein